MMTDAKKRANAKWNKENMKTLSCRISNNEYMTFKKYAEDHGKTISGMLLDYVRKCIANNTENQL